MITEQPTAPDSNADASRWPVIRPGQPRGA